MMEIKGTPYSYDDRQQELIIDLAQRVRTLREGGRLTPDVLARIRKFFRIKNIYHSNAIEGNQLNVGETRQVVELGLTITGKPLKDQAEAKNLSHALDYLEELASKAEPLTENDVRSIHKLILTGIVDDEAGRYRRGRVEISGSAFKPPEPLDVQPQMAAFGEWLKQVSVPGGNFATAEGLISAAVAHTWFVSIHPFIDGNGRVARLLMNLLLMRYGFPIGIIGKEDRARYYDALEISQSSDISPFIGLINECILESLEEYEHAVKEHIESQEWARAVAEKFTQPEKIKASNEYEVWRSSMELLKSYFKQTAAMLAQSSPMGRVYFVDFGGLELEKYLALRTGDSAKRTWFFRIDFRSGDRAARYLFFFGSKSYVLRSECDVTLHVAREEKPYVYERLELISAPNTPSLLEIGYKAKEERFVARYRNNRIERGKIEDIGRTFIEEVVSKHFAS